MQSLPRLAKESALQVNIIFGSKGSEGSVLVLILYNKRSGKLQMFSLRGVHILQEISSFIWGGKVLLWACADHSKGAQLL